MTPDPLDRALIAILRKNARTSVVDMARQLGVSRATIQNRMNRLEKERVIVSYTVTLQSTAQESPVRALMSIATQSAKEAAVVRALRGIVAVVAIHHTTGRWDLIADLRTESLASFNHIVGQIRLIDGVTTTESNLLLDSYEFG